MRQMGRLGRVVVVLVGLLGGITGAHADDTVIRMWTFLNPQSKDPRAAILKRLTTEFEAANPGVHVEIEPQIWDRLSMKFLTSVAAGTGPDISWVHLPEIPIAIKRGALVNLNPYFIDQWPASEKADLDDPLWRYEATDHAHYFIVHSRTYNGIVYRADILKAAGIDPAQLTTWDKFIAAAKKLTVRNSSGTVVQWGFGQAFGTTEAEVQAAFNMMLTKQKDVFDDACHATWDTPAGIDSMKLQTQMIEQMHITPPASVSYTLEDLYDEFAAGRIVMIRGTSARMEKMKSLLGADKVGFMLNPGFVEGQPSRSEVDGWGIAVSTHSRHKALAAKYVEFLSSREADKLWTFKGGSLPIRHSTVESDPAFFRKPAYVYLDTATEGIDKYGWLSPPQCNTSGFKEDMNMIMQDVLTNGTNIATALKNGQDAYNKRHSGMQ